MQLQQSAKIQEYLKIVCNQIRWKRAHNVVSKEIENHIHDQRDAFIKEGYNEETATNKAITEMGDPVIVGTELDHSYRPNIEWKTIILTCIILAIGLFIRMFITYDSDKPWQLTRSIISIVIGAAFMLLVYKLDFTLIGKYPRVIYIGLMLGIIGIMLFTNQVNGRNLYAYFFVLLFPTAFAGIIYLCRNKGYLGVLLCTVFYLIPLFLSIIIPSFSTLFIILIAGLSILTLAILKGWFNVKKLLAIVIIYVPIFMMTLIAFISLVFNAPYRLDRLQSIINPYADPFGAGYMAIKTREVLLNSKLVGNVVGSNARTFLPAFDTDLMLTYVISRVGWIALFVIIAILTIFIIRSIILIKNQKSILGTLVSFSVIVTFSMQVIIYIAFDLGIQLFSPLTLPLISYSSMGTIINMILIGILLSVFNTGDLIKDRVSFSKLV